MHSLFDADNGSALIEVLMLAGMLLSASDFVRLIRMIR